MPPQSPPPPPPPRPPRESPPVQSSGQHLSSLNAPLAFTQHRYHRALSQEPVEPIDDIMSDEIDWDRIHDSLTTADVNLLPPV